MPVLPIALVGAYAAMPYGATVPVPGRPHVHVVFGRPLRAAPGEIAHQFSDRLHRYVVEMHDTTARAYGMPTQADFARAVALRAAAAQAERDADAEVVEPVVETARDDVVRSSRPDDGHAQARWTQPLEPPPSPRRRDHHA